MAWDLCGVQGYAATLLSYGPYSAFYFLFWEKVRPPIPSLLIYFPDWVGLTPSYTILFMTSLAVCLLCAAVQGHVCTLDPYHGRDPALPLHGHQVRRSAAQGVSGSQDKKLPSDDYLNEVLY